MCSYVLTLAVDDNGKRSFTAERHVANQAEMARSLAYDLKLLLGIMNDPPAPEALVRFISEDSAWEDSFIMMAYLKDKWDGENNFDDAFKVIVDLDCLVPTFAEDERETIKGFLDDLGWEYKENEEYGPTSATPQQAPQDHQPL